MDAALKKKISALEQEGKTVIVVQAGKRIDGLIALRDAPRRDAAPALQRLAIVGVKTVMRTGDNRRTADAIGGALGIEVQAELLPDAKLTAIEALKRSGHVAMAGDGINDAPALAAATVGVAMGEVPMSRWRLPRLRCCRIE